MLHCLTYIILYTEKKIEKKKTYLFFYNLKKFNLLNKKKNFYIKFKLNFST